MHNKHCKRLHELTKTLSSEKIIEFLELYGIMKAEMRAFEELEGIISLKEFFQGALENKEVE